MIDAQSLSERLAEPGLLVLDATVHLRRPPGGGPYRVESGREDYLSAHIPGAAFADVAGDLADPEARFPFALPSPERFARAAGALGIGAGKHVVTYSQASPMWATRLWWLLRYFGFDEVSVLDGGLAHWRALGLPVEVGPVETAPAQFTPRVRRELLALREEVIAVTRDGGSCLLNALAPEIFRGEGPSSYSRPGRIPGSSNAFWGSLVDPDTGCLLSPVELERALEEAGALGEEPVIAYCGGGISATVVLFALSLVGDQRARLYDGSLTEWSADPALPLEVG
jgi:thiosulfate/3-mercaptopyruvate sulfurtransferase